EAVRFAKSGSDAVSAAVRMARALTGRDVVLCAGYHGWHDWYIGSTSRDRGVPKAVQDLTAAFRFDDLDHLDHVLDANRGEVAAVVVEPSGATVPPPGHLEGIIERAHAHGALCVFDEIITGLRLAPGGARERYGVEPDLSCYGKALGNGMPVSAVAGRWEHMAMLEEVFFSGTHGGEALSLAAARAVLDTVADGTVLAGIESLGQVMLDGVVSLVERHDVAHRVTVGGEPQRTVVGTCGPEPLIDKTWIQQCLLEAGCLFNGSMFIAAAHTSGDVEIALEAFDQAFAGLAGDESVEDRLAGPVLEQVFRAP
ncbi:MAG: aminotransferase class III-fold pyridoxal phosphate-dependent enzyme, partial [Actinomycetota bacterium]